MNVHFISRHYNDLDHAIPLAIYFKKIGLNFQKISIIYHGNFFRLNINDNAKINYLRLNKINFTICLEKKLILKFLLFFFRVKNSLFKLLIYKLINRINNPLNFLYNYISILKSNNDIVFFDLHVEKNFNQKLITKLKEKNIKVFAFSHGLTLFNYKNKNFSKNYLMHQHPYQIYEKIILYNEFHRNFFKKKGLGHDYTISIGSPRFSEYWLNILANKIFKDDINRMKSKYNKKKNILLFLEKSETYAKGIHQTITDISNQENIIKFLNSQDKYNIFIKFNTRGNTNYQLKFKNIYKNIFFFDEKIESSILINCSDYVMGGGTSVICEAFLKNIPVFILDFLHPNHELIYKSIDFPNIINSYAEFKDIYWNKIISDSSDLKLNNHVRNNFIKHYIGTKKSIDENLLVFSKIYLNQE